MYKKSAKTKYIATACRVRYSIVRAGNCLNFTKIENKIKKKQLSSSSITAHNRFALICLRQP